MSAVRDPIRVAVVGCGNMGAALARGLAGADGIEVVAVDPDTDRARSLLGDASVKLSATLATLGEGPPPALVVLAVKPQALPAILPGLAPVLPAETAVVSIAAGISCANLRAALGRERPVFRAMPNMPALIGHGMTVIYADAATSPHRGEVGAAAPGEGAVAHARSFSWSIACSFDARSPDVRYAPVDLSPVGRGSSAVTLCQRVFATVGRTVWVAQEEQIDLATAVSGSGPAYVFAFVEQFACAAARIGLPAGLADALARATVIGAAGMLAHSEGRVEALKAAVTSPGGTTRAALDVLEARNALPSLLKRTLTAALRRARALADEGALRPKRSQ